MSIELLQGRTIEVTSIACPLYSKDMQTLEYFYLHVLLIRFYRKVQDFVMNCVARTNTYLFVYCIPAKKTKTAINKKGKQKHSFLLALILRLQEWSKDLFFFSMPYLIQCNLYM